MSKLHSKTETKETGSTIRTRSILMASTSTSFLRPSKVVQEPLQSFLTHSSYEGSWSNKVHTMDGFGCYRYPDGSEYRGCFQRGKFHGYGQLKLAAPYKFNMKGHFVEGKLKNISDMWFEDGLHVEGTFEDGHLNCKNWKYLSESDRRYQGELTYGQQPVGPTSYLTKNPLARSLNTDNYDAEEGMFNSKTGWLTDRKPPFSQTFYVNCDEDKAWIMRHCRKGCDTSTNSMEPEARFCRQIINNNLEDENIRQAELCLFSPANNLDFDRKRYFHKLCEQIDEQSSNSSDEANSSSTESDINVGDSSCDTQSFSDDSLSESVDKSVHDIERMDSRDFNLNVVQSNLTRGPITAVNTQHSTFQL